MIKEELMRQHTDVSELVPEMYKFDPKEVSYLVYGSKEKYRMLSDVERKCAAPPIIHNLDRREAFRINLERGRQLKENIDKFGFPKIDYMNNQFYGNMQNGLYPSNMSHAMFEALIRVLGTDEQIKKYLQDTLDEKILG